jgi:hypothetical protein
LRQPLGIVHVLTARQPTIDRLPQQISQRKPRIDGPRTGQVLLDEHAKAQSFVQLPHSDQPAIGSHPRRLEPDPQRPIERQMKRLFLLLTRWVYTSERF